MKAYRVEKQIAANGELTLSALPFQAGEEVEVIILSQVKSHSSVQPVSLRGKVIEYIDPTSAVVLTQRQIAHRR
jgi:hypothetical protein